MAWPAARQKLRTLPTMKCNMPLSTWATACGIRRAHNARSLARTERSRRELVECTGERSSLAHSHVSGYTVSGLQSKDCGWCSHGKCLLFRCNDTGKPPRRPSNLLTLQYTRLLETRTDSGSNIWAQDSGWCANIPLVRPSKMLTSLPSHNLMTA